MLSVIKVLPLTTWCCVVWRCSDGGCPAGAKGFWGCIFLGLMLSTVAEVGLGIGMELTGPVCAHSTAGAPRPHQGDNPHHMPVCVCLFVLRACPRPSIGPQVPQRGAARLVSSLLLVGSSSSNSSSLFPDASKIHVICPCDGAYRLSQQQLLAMVLGEKVPDRWRFSAPDSFVQYHAQQFVSAVLVLLRILRHDVYRVSGRKQFGAGVAELHDSLERVSRLLCVVNRLRRSF